MSWVSLKLAADGEGAEALADYEILEVLLFANYPREDTKPIAKALIERFGSLASVLAARAEELQEGLLEFVLAGVGIPNLHPNTAGPGHTPASPTRSR
jgi:hypothetical protein